MQVACRWSLRENELKNITLKIETETEDAKPQRKLNVKYQNVCSLVVRLRVNTKMQMNIRAI